MDGYEPTVSVSTMEIKEKIGTTVKDNGLAYREKALDEIYQPFFTTNQRYKG